MSGSPAATCYWRERNRERPEDQREGEETLDEQAHVAPAGPRKQLGDSRVLDLFGRGGAFFWKNKVKLGDGKLEAETDGTDFAWGFGAAFRLGSFSLRAEYERAEISSLKPWMVTAGATIAF